MSHGSGFEIGASGGCNLSALGPVFRVKIVRFIGAGLESRNRRILGWSGLYGRESFQVWAEELLKGAFANLEGLGE